MNWGKVGYYGGTPVPTFHGPPGDGRKDERTRVHSYTTGLVVVDSTLVLLDSYSYFWYLPFSHTGDTVTRTRRFLGGPWMGNRSEGGRLPA